MRTTSVLVCPDASTIAARALDLLLSQLSQALTARGEAHLALTGGSSAATLLRLLRDDPRARRLDWSGVHVWLGDERFVPTSHPDSNWGMAEREWLSAAGAPPVRRHPFPVDEAIATGQDADWAARRYGAELAGLVPERDGVPALDVVLLGMGPDGHVLSAFPEGPALGPDAPLCLPVAAPEHIGPHVARVTLSPRLLTAAGIVLVMVPGAAKREAVERVFQGPRDPRRVPAQLALRPNAVWLLDAACADAARGHSGESPGPAT